jgi:hypothetical protein
MSSSSRLNRHTERFVAVSRWPLIRPWRAHNKTVRGLARKYAAASFAVSHSVLEGALIGKGLPEGWLVIQGLQSRNLAVRPGGRRTSPCARFNPEAENRQTESKKVAERDARVLDVFKLKRSPT